MELPSGRAALCLSTSSFPGVPLAVQLKHASLGHAGPGPHDLTGVTHGVQMTSQEPLPRGAHLCLAPGSCGLSAALEHSPSGSTRPSPRVTTRPAINFWRFPNTLSHG